MAPYVGSESMESLRFAQLVHMIGDLFSRAPLTDVARQQMLALVQSQPIFMKPVDEDDADSQTLQESPTVMQDPPITLLPTDIRNRKRKKQNGK